VAELEQLKDWLYELVIFIAKVHDQLVAYNRTLPSPYTDKEMHFIVVAAFGLLFFLLILPLFLFLTRYGRAGLMAWLFTFMTILFVALAIEEGQRLTRTGSFQLLDAAYGIAGFLAVSVVLGVLYLLYLLIRWLFRK